MTARKVKGNSVWIVEVKIRGLGWVPSSDYTQAHVNPKLARWIAPKKGQTKLRYRVTEYRAGR